MITAADMEDGIEKLSAMHFFRCTPAEKELWRRSWRPGEFSRAVRALLNREAKRRLKGRTT